MTVYAPGNLDEHAAALDQLGSVIGGESLPSIAAVSKDAKGVQDHEDPALTCGSGGIRPSGTSRHARFQAPRNDVRKQSRGALPLVTVGNRRNADRGELT